MASRKDEARKTILSAVKISPIAERADDTIEGDSLLPADCPVVPLGKSGDFYYYLDAQQELRIVLDKDHGRLRLHGMFGVYSTEFLHRHYARTDKDGNIVGWRPEQVAEDLQKEAARMGVIDLFDKVRGAGAWRDDDGNLVLHCGDGVLIGTEWYRPGVFGGYYYPRAARKPPPADIIAPGGVHGPAAELLKILQSWKWRRPEIDPFILLGWIGAAMIGGALEWRVLTWITGDKGTGKSSLHKLLKELFGDGGLLSVTDATPAGVWQKVKHSALPVAIDELEASEDNKRANDIIKLARMASSGAVLLRGGADHQGADFVVRTCFLFSSILIPPLLGQDRSRMAILELDDLPIGSTPPLIEPQRIRALGAALRRRMVDGWPRLARTLELFRVALGQSGHNARGADQFGTLLACQELLLQDEEIDSDGLREWSDRLATDTLAEHGDDLADHERCLAHLLSQPADVYRNGGRRVVGQWILDAAGDRSADTAEANAVLGTYGLKVIIDSVAEGGRKWVAIANAHGGLEQLYRGTHWSGRSGAQSVFVQAFHRIPGARYGRECRERFNGVQIRCTVLPLEAVTGPDKKAPP